MPVRISRASSVIIHSVPPSSVDRFLALQEEFSNAAQSFPGFQGSEIFPPLDPTSKEWVVLIHFSDPAALQSWLGSEIRSEWVDRVRRQVGEFHLETLPRGFGGWFTDTATKSNTMPPSWKMVLVVLLGLYPTVVLLTATVGQVTGRLGFSIAMLIGNALSVCLLQYAVMPVLTRVLKPWLNMNAPEQRSRSLAIALAIGGLLTVLAFLFRLALN